MTQIQPDQQTQNNDANQVRNRPADLDDQTLAKPSHNNDDSSITIPSPLSLPSSMTTNNPHQSSSNPQPPPSVPTPLDHPRSYAPMQPNNPLEIGRSDLEPIGTSNLGIPSLYNHLPRGELDQRSGMMVHPNHPIFQPSSRLGQPEAFHPPGARFDPIGPNSSPFGSRPRANPGFDLDPMGGLGQGLPLQNPHFFGFHSNRPDFNEFRPPGPGGPGGSA